ncbi:MAG: alpha/beta hydrolase [Pirellulales bacterium]|nr:alpha/beta hydrolase [Pirellulales bacterium]
MPSPQFNFVLQFVRARPADYHQAPIERLRRDFVRSSSLASPPEDLRLDHGTLGPVPVGWFHLPESRADRVLFYLHGGGFVLGSPITHRELISQLARASATTAVAVDYRLAPEHPFPAAHDDALAAYRGLLAEGIQGRQIVVGGDSAGGALALRLVQRLRDEDVALPAACVLISPWTDLTQSAESYTSVGDRDPMLSRAALQRMADLYLAGHPADDPAASPLLGDLSGLPPLLIHVGSAEILLDDSTRLAERARAAGTEVTLEIFPEMIHVWHFFASVLPEAQAAVAAVGRFIQAHIG